MSLSLNEYVHGLVMDNSNFLVVAPIEDFPLQQLFFQ